MKRLLAAACLFLCSCSALPGLGPGLQTADTVVRGACGAILATPGGSTQDTLAALQSVEKQLVALAAEKAAQSNPDAAAALQAGLAANAAAMRALAEQLLRLAGSAAPAASSAPYLPPPAASVPVGAAPVRP